MEREQLVRNDFPKAHGTTGFDMDSVGAHLAAVAAHVAALEARITALEIERDRLRQQLEDAVVTEEPVESPSAGPRPGESADAGPADADAEVAARMLASKLAMGGTNRDTIVMQVAAEHEIDDPGALVDDVLARLA